MKSPTFSIIIPTFNSSKTIENCLNSIIDQNFSDYEILVIDGVSTDSTIDIIKTKYTNQVKLFSEPDLGIYDAMNKGIDFSKGKWLFFLGSDDSIYDKFVLVNVAETILSTEKKIVYGNVYIDGDAGWAQSGEIYAREFDLKKILTKNICHQSIFYHSDLFKNFRYNINYRVCADYDLNIRLFAKFPFHFIDLTIAKFSGGGSSKTIIDHDFLLSNVVIEAFFFKLIGLEFRSFSKQIRAYAKKSPNLLKQLYLNFIYLKHRIL